MNFRILASLIAAAALLAPLLFEGPADARAPERTRISGADLAHELTLSVTDEDAFGRRLAPPPKLDNAPDASGASYTVVSTYWDKALRNGRDDRPPAAESASYYPDGGYVKARQGGSDVWIALDLRQRATLDRYIRLGRGGSLANEPGVLEVLATAAKTEVIGVQVADRQLSDGEARAFWQAAAAVATTKASAQVRTQLLEASTAPDEQRMRQEVWIVFTLPEARSVQVVYFPRLRVLADSFLTEFLEAPDGWLVPAIGPSGQFPNPELASVEVQQQAGAGSPVWWAVMVGGGLGLLAIALKLRSSRRTSPAA